MRPAADRALSRAYCALSRDFLFGAQSAAKLRTGRKKPVESIKSGGTLYFVTFQLEDGSQKELQVWQDIHHGVREGEYGLLTYRGDKFKSFQMSTMRAQQA